MFFVLNLLCLQGELEVVKVIPNKRIIDEKENMENQSDGGAEQYASAKETFLMLGLDLPPPQDVMEKNIIPQVLLHLMLFCLLHIDTTRRLKSLDTWSNLPRF